MSGVSLSAAVRSNLRSLQSASELMGQTEQRLSTGKKVNSALDNPSSFFTAQALDRRASDLNNMLDSVSNSVQTLKAADNGITAINDVIESLKATARSAVQSPQAVTTKASISSTAIDNLSETNLLGGAPSNATVEGSALTNDNTGTAAAVTANTKLSGTAGAASDNLASGLTAGEKITVNGTEIEFVASGATGNQVNITDDIGDLLAKIDGITGASTASTVAAGKLTISTGTSSDLTIGGSSATLTKLGLTAGTTARGTPTGGLAGQTLNVQDRDGNTKTVTFSSSGIDTLDELNKFFSDNNVDLEASVSVDAATKKGTLTLTTANAAANKTPVDLEGTATASGAAFASKSFSAPVVSGAGKETRDNYRKDFNDALKQISSLAKDASYNGVNLLNGDDLSIVFNEDGSSKLDVKGVDFDAASLGITELSADDFYDSNSINKIIDKLDKAAATLEQTSSKFGSQLQIVQTRQTFTKNMIGTLQDGAGALTDADTNEEAANLATLQTKQSLIVSSLAISTSQEQSILSLLR